MTMLVIHLLFGAFMMLPHGDLDRRIEEVSRQIQAFPDSIQLLLKRGELYIQHEEYNKAKQDFSACLLNNYKNNRVLTGLSTVYLFEGPVDSSLYYINEVIQMDPRNLSAIELKAKAFLKLDRNCEAANAFQEILSTADRPAPLLFIQASSAFEHCDQEGSIDSAIIVLKEGIIRIPGNRVLQNQLVLLYKHAGMTDEVLEIQSSMIDQSTFKARPYFERAKTYTEIGKFEEAKQDLHSSLAILEALPPKKKDLPSMESLKEEILAHLKSLEN